MPTFFVPGPTFVSSEVLAELTRPAISHRSRAYGELHGEVVDRLKNLFGWKNYHVFLVTSSATGVMEGVIRNCVEKTVIHTTCGAFSEKWGEISEMNGKKIIKIEKQWGQAIKPEDIEPVLKKTIEEKNPAEAITFTHCETSTGVLNPIEKLCKSVKKISPETLIFVDSVSAFGGAPADVEKLGIDVLFFGVQKTFALPPGLTIAVVSERALEKSKKIQNKGYYFNFEVLAEYNAKNNTPSTPAIPLIYGLKKQLERMKTESIKNRFERHNQMLDAVKAWSQNNGFKLFAEKGYESPTVTCLIPPEDISVQKLVEKLKEEGFTVPAGYGKLKEQAFRIGHMGENNQKDVENLLVAITNLIKNKSCTKL